MQQKSEKDKQPSVETPREGLSEDQMEGDPQGWSLKDIAREGSQIEEDEVYRQGRRADETEGDPDERDAAGRSEFKDTWQGREEAKNDVKGKANANG